MSVLTRTPPEVEEVLDAVAQELHRATAKFGPFVSPHEATSIILEEIDELWDEIKGDKLPGARGRMRKEALQVAAMGCRYLLDLTPRHDWPSVTEHEVEASLRGCLVRETADRAPFASPHEAHAFLRMAARHLDIEVDGGRDVSAAGYALEIATLASRFLLDIPEEN